MRGTVPIRFVILSSPRTGSNFLCSYLNSHPEILCHHELYNRDGIRYALHLRDGSFDMGTMAERDRDPVGFLQRVLACPMGARRLGFKLAHSHPEPVFQHVFEDREMRAIILRRRNRIKTHVSDLVAMAEGRWTHYDVRKEELPKIRVRVDVDELIRYTNVAERYYTWIEDSLQGPPSRVMRVFYEDLFTTKTQEEILEFLGLPRNTTGLQGATFKRNPDDLRTLVENYDELVQRLAGHPLGNDLTLPAD